MIFEFEKEQFDLKKIKQLYPAAMINTGYKDELTPISLKWYDSDINKNIKAVKYGIFFHLDDNSVKSFFYNNRELLEDALYRLEEVLSN